jgi:hypothetical protein
MAVPAPPLAGLSFSGCMVRLPCQKGLKIGCAEQSTLADCDAPDPSRLDEVVKHRSPNAEGAAGIVYTKREEYPRRFWGRCGDLCVHL